MSTQADHKVQQTNTVAEAIRNLTQIHEVKIGTTPKETIWEDGKVSLFHFKCNTPAKAKTPVLIVYALVNRWEMMDLQPDRSLFGKCWRKDWTYT